HVGSLPTSPLDNSYCSRRLEEFQVESSIGCFCESRGSCVSALGSRTRASKQVPPSLCRTPLRLDLGCRMPSSQRSARERLGRSQARTVRLGLAFGHRLPR